MDATCLQHLVWYLPEEVREAMARNAVIPTSNRITMHSALDAETLAFIEAYRDLSFGWKFASAMAQHRRPFPGIIEGDDEVLFRAYLHCCNPTRYRNDSLTSARALAFGPLQHVRQTLEALLLTRDATIAGVADRMKLDHDVVLSYERLFFNVIDRKKDEHFIAEVVYPNGRIVEFANGYTSGADLDSQIKRAGFNNGAEHVLHFAGYWSGLLHTLAGPEAAAKLEGTMMANGMVLAANGWLNQSQNAAGVHHARVILAATKQGGQEVATPSTFSSVGGAILAEMVQVKMVQAKDAASFKADRSKATKADVVKQ